MKTKRMIKLALSIWVLFFTMDGATNTQADTHQHYFPLNVGNSWTYVKSDDGSTKTFTIIGTEEINGHSYYKFDDYVRVCGFPGCDPESCVPEDTDMLFRYEPNTDKVLQYRSSTNEDLVRYDFSGNRWPDGYGNQLIETGVSCTVPAGQFDNCCIFEFAMTVDCGEFFETLALGVGNVRFTEFCEHFELHSYTIVPGPAMIYYVDDDANGVNDGSSWTDAYRYLQNGLAAAWSGDEIRVAQGIYKPVEGVGIMPGSRTATFQMKNGVTVKGGYAGFGEPDPDARDIELYETILSGDLLGNDEPDFANNGDNSYHIVTGSGTDETAVLDGFTITAGNANGQGYPLYQNCGGGMFNYGYSAPNPNSPTLNNCTFRYNFAISSGGGICNRWKSSPKLTDCIFIGNSANQGGGMSNSYLSNSTLINCIFIGNSATGDTFGGGGIFVYDTGQTLINCLFLGNSASYGGGMDFSDNHEINLINCVFSGNSADYGGGMHSWYFCEGVNLYNCSFSKNSANYFGGAICCDEEYGTTQEMDLINCILWGNNDSSSLGEFSQIYPSVYDLSVSYCDIQGGWPGEENIDADPLFVDPDGPDGIAGTQDDDLRLSANSPCIDAGDNSAVTVTTDLAGNQRIANNFVDMGAYEFIGMHVIYVDDDAPGDPGPGDPEISDPDENGTEAHPFDTIQEAIDCARNGHTVLVLPGNYNEAFNFISKSITVTSGGEEPAVLEAPGDYAATFHSGEDPNSILKNFIIRNSNIGVFCNHASPTLKYLTVVENASGIEAWNASLPQISNSICWDNDNSDLLLCQAVYSCIERESAGLGNLSADPLFADPSNLDYHLKSKGWRWRDLIAHGSHWTWDGVTSPCIDAGNPGSALGAEPLAIPEDPNNQWGLNLRANMGAYGGTAQASMAIPGWCLQSDTDNDGRVDMKELIMLRDQWLVWEIRESYCDFNRDGIVNLGDYQVLAKEWLKEALRIR